MISKLSSPWPNLRLYARDCGEIDPYDPRNADLFRGEEAFAPDVEGWKRWSKPSPEPRLDADFDAVLLESIARNGPTIHGLVRELARRITEANPEPPVLVAVLRAGVPICALLAPILTAHYGEDIPICAFSLFYGLGWDEAALDEIIADFPNREMIFVDGWTSGGGVAKQIESSFKGWRERGKLQITKRDSPQFAVLCDPRYRANLRALCADFFVPSAAFTAPETLGFSRGFAREDGGLFGVYRFPRTLQKPRWIEAWLAITDGEIAPLPPDNPPNSRSAPDGFRVDVNEVMRALINRNPLEIWLRASQTEASETLAPLLYLAQKRGVKVEFERHELESWGTLAAAKMK